MLFVAFFFLPSFLFQSFPSCLNFSIFKLRRDSCNQMREQCGRRWSCAQQMEVKKNTHTHIHGAGGCLLETWKGIAGLHGDVGVPAFTNQNCPLSTSKGQCLDFAGSVLGEARPQRDSRGTAILGILRIPQSNSQHLLLTSLQGPYKYTCRLPGLIGPARVEKDSTHSHSSPGLQECSPESSYLMSLSI